MYIIIGEWDDFYEEYALHGMFSEETRKQLQRGGVNAGFLTMKVYGPFGAANRRSRYESMKQRSFDLLALSMYLSRASTDLPSTSSRLPMVPGSGCCKCQSKPQGTPGTTKPSKWQHDIKERIRKKGTKKKKERTNPLPSSPPPKKNQKRKKKKTITNVLTMSGSKVLVETQASHMARWQSDHAPSKPGPLA